MFENRLLKEEVQALIKELENWEEACRKQGERKLQILVEVADQLEGSNPTEPGNEEERVVCPTYGEIFNESGYKVIIRAFTTQQSTPTTVEGQGQLDLRDDGTPKEKIHEKEVADEQDAVTQKVASLNIIDGEIPKEKLQEREASDEQDDTTQELASLNIPVKIATNHGIEEPEDEIIPDFMDEYCTETPKSSHYIEIIDIEPQ